MYFVITSTLKVNKQDTKKEVEPRRNAREEIDKYCWVDRPSQLPTSEGGKKSYAVKANIAVKGMLTTAGSTLLENYRPTYYSDVVRRLNEKYQYHGTVICDTFAVGTGQNANIPLLNPPLGGSSTGCGWVLRTRQVDFAIGTSTGGSSTQPAIQSRLYSFQGSRGAISRYGVFPYYELWDRPSVLTKCPLLLKEVSCWLMSDPAKRDELSTQFTQYRGNLLPTVYVYEDSPILSERVALAGLTSLLVSYNKDAVKAFYIEKTSDYLYSNLQRYDGVRFNPSPLAYAADEVIRSANRKKGFSTSITQRIKTPVTGKRLPEPPLFVDATLNPQEGYHLIRHRIAKTQEQLIEKDFEKCIPNVYNLASLTAPFDEQSGIQLLAPAGREHDLWRLCELLALW